MLALFVSRRNIMQVLQEIENQPGHYMVNCPGCKMMHVINTVDDSKPKWSFNNNRDKPTFSPSLLVRYPWGPEQKQMVCHSFIRDGQWQFLTDCTHELKGKTIDMIDVDDD